MKGLFAGVMLAVVINGCGAGDDTTLGTRSECAHGGALVDCPDAERTPQAACWRLVDCGAISVKSDNANRFTWGRCVDRIMASTDVGQQLIINCIAASSCDQLQVQNSPKDPDPSKMACFELGRGQ